MTAEAPTKEGGLKTIGRPLQKGHKMGRPKGSKDRRRLAAEITAKGLEAKAWDVVAALLQSRAWRSRFEAARLVLAYAVGLPRQTIDISAGPFSAVATELAEALRAAREARASAVLDRGGAPALGAPVVDVEPIEAPAAVPVAPVRSEEAP